MILYKSLSFLFARQNGHGALRQTVNGLSTRRKQAVLPEEKKLKNGREAGGWRLEAGGVYL